jgi:hypothetical protein
MHKESFIINHCTLLHVSTLLGNLQGEIFVTVTLRSGLASRDRREFTPPKTTQYAVNSTFSLNYKVQPYNKKFSLKMTQQFRNM